MEENKIMNEIGVLGQKIWGEKEARMLSPLQLAYIGDAIYEVFVRSYILEHNNKDVNRLHKIAIKYVKAASQATFVKNMWEELTEEERYFVKRGRNTKSSSVPKNANKSDYRYATGFETMFGYLYMTGKIDRMKWIFEEIVKMQKPEL